LLVFVAVTKGEIVASATRALVVVFQPFDDAESMEMMLTFWVVGKRNLVSFFVINQTNGAIRVHIIVNHKLVLVIGGFRGHDFL
jgi:hypothetical protein